MKISGDRSTAGFPVDKNEKPTRTQTKAGSGESALRLNPDELELTGKSTAALNNLRETTNESSTAFCDNMASIKAKLASLNSAILANPSEAVAAHANLNPEAVARLVG